MSTVATNYNEPMAEMPKCSQVVDQKEQLYFAIERLDASVREIEIRLNPVLSLSGGETNNCPPDDVLVPLADELRSMRKMVQQINCRSDAILNGLEL